MALGVSWGGPSNVVALCTQVSRSRFWHRNEMADESSPVFPRSPPSECYSMSDDEPPAAQPTPPSAEPPASPRAPTPKVDIDTTTIETDDETFMKHLNNAANQGAERLTIFEEQNKNAEPEWAKMLRDASENGVPTGTALSQRMFRSLSPLEKEEYDKLGRSHTLKSAWRQRWAQRKYQEVLKERSKIESWQTTEVEDGSYMSLSKIVAEEGGDESAKRAARLYCLKAAMMGGVWCRRPELTTLGQVVKNARRRSIDPKGAFGNISRHKQDASNSSIPFWSRHVSNI